MNASIEQAAGERSGTLAYVQSRRSAGRDFNACLHEAAHGVALVLLGGEVEELQVGSGKGHDGLCRARKLPGSAFEDAAWSLSGHVAVRLLGEPDTRYVASGSDIAHVERMLGTREQNPDGWAGATALAYGVVRRHGQAVRTVAWLLHGRGRATHDDVQAALR